MRSAMTLALGVPALGVAGSANGQAYPPSDPLIIPAPRASGSDYVEIPDEVPEPERKRATRALQVVKILMGVWSRCLSDAAAQYAGAMADPVAAVADMAIGKCAREERVVYDAINDVFLHSETPSALALQYTAAAKAKMKPVLMSLIADERLAKTRAPARAPARAHTWDEMRAKIKLRP